MNFLTFVFAALFSFNTYAQYSLVSTEPNYDSTTLIAKEMTGMAIKKAKTKYFCVDGDIKKAYNEKKEEINAGYSDLYYVGGRNNIEVVDVVFDDDRIVIKVSANRCSDYKKVQRSMIHIGVLGTPAS